MVQTGCFPEGAFNMKKNRSWGDRLLMHHAVERDSRLKFFEYQNVKQRHYGAASSCRKCRIMREEDRLFEQSPTLPSWWTMLDILVVLGLGIRIFMALR
jgi:hypothetical protein